MNVREIFGTNMRRYRLVAELSQEELAARMGVEQYYISGLEAGRRNPTIETVARVAEALQVKVAQLFDERPQVKGPQVGSRRKSN
ncbi:MAG: helix-turn-helix domain-containing protein [Bradyrhizobium sp.]